MSQDTRDVLIFATGIASAVSAGLATNNYFVGISVFSGFNAIWMIANGAAKSIAEKIGK